jgi:hypothetical protein
MADRWEAARSSIGAAEAVIQGGSTGCLSWCTRCTSPCTLRPKPQRPVDLGYLLHGGVGDPPHVGAREPRHRVPLGPTEHHLAEEPQHVCLQVLVARLLVGIVPHERGLKKFKIQ